jgi:hypothetical protein
MLQIAASTSVNDLFAAEELTSRVIERSEHQLRVAYDRQAADARRATRLLLNHAAAHALECDERLSREEIELLCQDSYEVALTMIAAIFQKQHNMAVMRLRHDEHCATIFDAKMRRDAESDAAREAQDMQRGRDELKRQRELDDLRAAQRTADVLMRQKIADSFRAAQAFIMGKETRDRSELTAERDLAHKKFWRILRKSEKEARELEQLSFENSDSQKQLQAERERKLAEERQAAAKRELEFKKEQHRLVNKCIHSRTGTSVFLGPQPRKVCLICRVKFDEGLGIYTRM